MVNFVKVVSPIGSWRCPIESFKPLILLCWWVCFSGGAHALNHAVVLSNSAKAIPAYNAQPMSSLCSANVLSQSPPPPPPPHSYTYGLSIGWTLAEHSRDLAKRVVVESILTFLAFHCNHIKLKGWGKEGGLNKEGWGGGGGGLQPPPPPIIL